MRDYEIRDVLKQTHLFKYYHDEKSLVVDELDITSAGARIDIAVVNGQLHGFEIKGASDTLNRLPYQIEAYRKIFDYLTIVTEEKHYGKVSEIIPDWVGVILLDEGEHGEITIEQKKEAQFNSQKDAFFLAKLLWKEELLSLLKDLNIPHKKNLRTWLLCELIAKSIEVEELSSLVRSIMKKRSNWKNVKEALVA
ncbi:sce7726 family protein [Chitinophaga filiformis]|uniref:Sce7726 family protein n=1 Tax=Chitinophaga filiformis TaxID=104663 RepID=A0ABY4I5R3_CHIFI|nr:sce7726 family protein [Chitinophaga filiformis]UPK71420.1 sce7726 family protein [Chitinophaga filiformis]